MRISSPISKLCDKSDGGIDMSKKVVFLVVISIAFLLNAWHAGAISINYIPLKIFLWESFNTLTMGMIGGCAMRLAHLKTWL